MRSQGTFASSALLSIRSGCRGARSDQIDREVSAAKVALRRPAAPGMQQQSEAGPNMRDNTSKRVAARTPRGRNRAASYVEADVTLMLPDDLLLMLIRCTAATLTATVSTALASHQPSPPPSRVPSCIRRPPSPPTPSPPPPSPPQLPLPPSPGTAGLRPRYPWRRCAAGS
jgi:hypothetical protein